jgi:hypothetical protein
MQGVAEKRALRGEQGGAWRAGSRLSEQQSLRNKQAWCEAMEQKLSTLVVS